MLLADGRSIAYGKLLIATGARPRRLSLPGDDGRAMLYLRTWTDAIALRARLRPGARLVVIGGGFIGLEIAASAVERGCVVTVIEAAPRIMMRGVPAAVAAIVGERHRRAGIELRVGIGLAGVEPIGGRGDTGPRRRHPHRGRRHRRGRRRGAGDHARRDRRARDRERHPRRRADWRHPIPTSSPPATAAPSPTRSMAGAASGSKPGAMRRTRAPMRRAPCSAARAVRRSPVVLVGPARPMPADRRAARRGCRRRSCARMGRAA